MKFGQYIECSMRNAFEKTYSKCCEDTASDPFLES